MFEKEITEGSNHVSHHFCVDKFGNNFPQKSNLKKIENQLLNLCPKLDLSKYECNITSSNTTSDGDYFHISYLSKGPNEYLDKDTLNFFNINVNFPVLYFTRKIPFESNFKCGFYLNTYKSFKSKFFSDTIKIIKYFKNIYYDVWIAGDFDKIGNFIDNSINIEIFPFQTKENFYKIKNILLNHFDIDQSKINLYDKKFINYLEDDFFFHIKIKLNNERTIVKFYRTYPNNPFSKYYGQSK
jgi:hypothetical protein